MPLPFIPAGSRFDFRTTPIAQVMTLAGVVAIYRNSAQVRKHLAIGHNSGAPRARRARAAGGQRTG